MPAQPEEFMSPLEEIPEEESFTEDESSPQHGRRRIPVDAEEENSMVEEEEEEEHTSLIEDDEDDMPMTFNCDPRPDKGPDEEESEQVSTD